jgi:hypothetical protein
MAASRRYLREYEWCIKLWVGLREKRVDAFQECMPGVKATQQNLLLCQFHKKSIIF